MEKRRYNEADFDFLLIDFNKLVENNSPRQKVEKQLMELKEKAENMSALSFRQKEAIIVRCTNYLNGTYGNTKTSQNLSYGAPTK